MREETAEEAIARCHREKFSGSILIRFSNGVEREIEKHAKWKAPTRDGTVDLSEARE